MTSSRDKGPYRTRRQAAWAQRKRDELIDLLGGKCAQENGSCRGALQIDHIYGRDWDTRKYSQKGRVIRYWREYREGLATGRPILQPLCGKHNKEKGKP